MTTYAQDEWTRIFENMGGALSGMQRYEWAANLIGSSSYFAFVHRDEYDFFPDAADQLNQMTSLLRGIGYSADDGLLRLQITDGGTTFVAKIVDELGATISNISGTYGAEADVLPEAGVKLAPAGKIVIQAPTGVPAVNQEVEIRMVPSAARLSMDVTGETEEEALLEATALEAHQITASNFRNALFDAAFDSIVVGRLFQDLIGKWLGSVSPDETITKDDIFAEAQAQDSDGFVTANISGILPDLDTIMGTNTPAQSVAPIVATKTAEQFQSAAGTQQGVLTVSDRQPTTGTLLLKCVKGFTGNTEDPEEFEVRYLSSELEREIKSSFRLRPFRTFDWPSAGFYLELTRKTTDDDPLNRMSNVSLRDASQLRYPEQYITVETYVDEAAPITAQSYFKVFRPASTYPIYQVFSSAGSPPLADGSYEIPLSVGGTLVFDWTNGPTTGQALTFTVTIHPYVVGDRFVISYETAGGRLNKLLRKYFNFALQSTDASPTIPESVVAPDLPFVDIILGA